MKKTTIFFLLSATLLWGCATWVAVKGRYAMSSQNFEVELPDGWKKYNLSQDALLITKDGLPLQQIHIMRRSIDKEIPYTKKKLAKDMFPQEISEVVMDSIRSNPNIMNQMFIENIPAMIGGYPGIKLVFTYQTREGLTVKGINYCLLFGNWCYEIIYKAPVRYYFAKDLPDFEKVVKSFRLIETIPS